MTMKLIQTVDVGSGGSALISFTSIPQTYTDLVLVENARLSTSGGLTWYDYALRFNGSGAGTGYNDRFIYGQGSSVSVASDGSNNDGMVVRTSGASNTANTFGNVSFYIPNYTSANNKSFTIDQVSENNGGSAIQMLTASLWTNTAAITSIYLFTFSGVFTQYSSFSLYGITKGSGGATVS